MNAGHLGQEVRRLRTRAGITLRGLAAGLNISAPHLSDIEHNRRRPSEKLLRKIATKLGDVGATFESLELLVTGVDPAAREWVASTPGVRALLRKIVESGRSPHEIMITLEKSFGAGNRGRAAVRGGGGRVGRKGTVLGGGRGRNRHKREVRS